jgi:hypothetical protein
VRSDRARLALAVCALWLAGASAARAALAPAVTIDGPSPAIVALDGVGLAPDGSGALVYRKLVNGVAHVFASLERAGAWAAPVALDATVAAPATASAVAASSGGRVAVAWVAGGTLYGAVHPAGASSFGAPQAIAPAVGVPALGMGISGTAYVAYAAPDGAGVDVDVARLDRTSSRFAPLGEPMTAAPVTVASPGGGPSITVAADATAVVAWAAAQPDGSTHVFVRRASAFGPSPVLDDATVPTLDGLAGGSADSPSLGVAYDSSDAWVAFRETLGGFSRVLVDELLGDELTPPVLADSLGTAAGPASALAPSIAVNGNGDGLLAAELDPGNEVSVAARGSAAQPFSWTEGALLSPVAEAVAPAPLAALSESGIGAVVYSPQPGALDAELFRNANPAGAPLAISSTALESVSPGGGLGVAADDRGDLAIGFVAGATGAQSVTVRPVVVAPGAPQPTTTELWLGQSRPTLRWQASADSWTPPRYSVYIDSRHVATTTATSYLPPAAISDGRHTWEVVATDATGQRAASPARRLLVDAAPPLVRLTVGGVGAAVSFSVQSSALSGVAHLSVQYGDGTTGEAPVSIHTYAVPGSYEVTVTVTDRAGISAVLHRRLTVS